MGRPRKMSKQEMVQAYQDKIAALNKEIECEDIKAEIHKLFVDCVDMDKLVKIKEILDD